jgi:hypothetical protein
LTEIAQYGAGKLASVTPQQVLMRYLADERTADIASSLGVHRSGLNQWLLRHAEQEWKDAQVARAITALEKAKDDVESAADALSLARAREMLRSAQWELERLCSRIFGQKQEVSVTHNIVASLEKLASIDGEYAEVVDAVQQIPSGSEGATNRTE